MQLKHLSCPVAVKSVNESTGIVEAIVSVYGNRDSYGEVVRYGAWSKSITEKLPAVCWQHDLDEIIGGCLEARELAPGDALLPSEILANGGLWVKCHFDKNIPESWSAFTKIKNGWIKEWSVGFMPVRREDNQDGMDLLEGDLWEVSPVVRGANSLTATLSAKGQPLADQFETVLGAVEDVVSRFEWLAANRKNGLSDANMERVQKSRDALDAMLTVAAKSPADEKAPDLHPGEGDVYLFAQKLGY